MHIAVLNVLQRLVLLLVICFSVADVTVIWVIIKHRSLLVFAGNRAFTKWALIVLALVFKQTRHSISIVNDSFSLVDRISMKQISPLQSAPTLFFPIFIRIKSLKTVSRITSPYTMKTTHTHAGIGSTSDCPFTRVEWCQQPTKPQWLFRGWRNLFLTGLVTVTWTWRNAMVYCIILDKIESTALWAGGGAHGADRHLRSIWFIYSRSYNCGN